MKNLQTFDEFLNESNINESIKVTDIKKGEIFIFNKSEWMKNRTGKSAKFPDQKIEITNGDGSSKYALEQDFEFVRLDGSDKGTKGSLNFKDALPFLKKHK